MARRICTMSSLSSASSSRMSELKTPLASSGLVSIPMIISAVPPAVVARAARVGVCHQCGARVRYAAHEKKGARLFCGQVCSRLWVGAHLNDFITPAMRAENGKKLAATRKRNGIHR